MIPLKTNLLKITLEATNTVIIMYIITIDYVMLFISQMLVFYNSPVLNDGTFKATHLSDLNEVFV